MSHPGRLQGKRVLLTQASRYMGPATVELFRQEGAEVIADDRDLRADGAVEALVDEAGQIDILVANLAPDPEFGIACIEIKESDFRLMFETLVYPLHRLCRAILPGMYARKQGKVIVYGSALGLRAFEGAAAYGTARTAQIGYVRHAGMEAARHNVQINLIAQNFVENEYFSAELQNTDAFRDMMKSVPIGRLATGEEDARFAAFLASNEANFFVGQSFPFAGGWKE
ncbi:MAG: SDR family oxidoreductase [Gammaproteobacteria bacterium]|nr:SDR family oxidoreductase [Gammaproteobacteria bacterium]